MPPMPSLSDARLNVFLFAPRTGPDPVSARRQLADVWQAYIGRLGIDQPLPGIAADPQDPSDAESTAGRAESTAGRHAPGTALREMWWDAEHDVICLSVTLTGSGSGWSELYQEWSSATGDIQLGALIGVAFVYTALTDDIAAALPAHIRPPRGWADTAVTTRDGLTIWDLTPPGSAELARHVAVTASPGHDEDLGRWVWQAGLAPFVRYLINAAKVRYQTRVLRADQLGLQRQRRHAAGTLARLRPVLTDARTAGTDELVEAQRQLAVLQADEAGLVDALISVQTMRRTVQINAANIAAIAGTATAPDARNHVFSHDRAAADALDQDLDDQATYLDAASRRAQYFAAVAERELARRQQLDTQAHQQRQERFTLWQTAVVGTAVMALTAVQALGYRVPLSGPAQPAVILTFAAAALWLSLIALRFTGGASGTVRGTKPRAVPEAVASGALVAGVAWTVGAIIRAGRPAVVILGAVAFLTGLAVSLWLARRRSRRY